MDQQPRSPKRQRIHGRAKSTSLVDVDFDADTRRIILLVDLDSFYAAASRIRDPSLIGLPLGIKQKGILATASYEARALGVQKLATVKEAVRRCPELILVNGEDLSFFRKLSNQVWRLVRSIVWGAKVEKQGLDELFCDVTDMIDFNLGGAQAGSSGGTAFFRLDESDPSIGFSYDSSSLIGHTIPTSSREDDETFIAAQRRRRLLMASHLAHYIRQQILHQVGLASSAGVAHNKLIAKLMCSKHKPSDQTVFLPRSRLDVLRLLDDYEARSLNGFGGAIVNKLRVALGGESLGHGGTEWLNGGLGLDPQAALQQQRGQEPPVPLTVSLCRKAFSMQDLIDLFGQRLGPRLWGLLHGIDEEDVVPAPPFPHQLSVEDTYRGLRGDDISVQLRVLSDSLLRRLEAELVDDDFTAASAQFTMVNDPLQLPSDVGKEPSLDLRGITVRSYTERDSEASGPMSTTTSAPKRTWKRYPLSLRLSIRQGWENRTSRQTRMPVEVFSPSLPRSTRIAAVVDCLTALHRGMIATHGDKGEGLNLLNVAALDLATEKPAPALGTFFSTSSVNAQGIGPITANGGSLPLPRPPVPPSSNIDISPNRRPDASDDIDSNIDIDIDLEVLSQLPLSIQKDVARQHRLSLSRLLQVAASSRKTVRREVSQLDQDEVKGKGKDQIAPSLPEAVMTSAMHSEAKPKPEPEPEPKAGVQTDPDADADPDADSDPDSEVELMCSFCGQLQSPWLQHDHAKWPVFGLPQCFLDDAV